MMKKIDKMLAAGLLLAAVLLGIFLFAGKEEGTRAVVTIDGTEYGSYALDKEQTIDLGTGNHLEIRGGEIRMTEADCPDQICVHTARISEDGGSIVCLPNKIVLEIVGEEKDEPELDSISS